MLAAAWMSICRQGTTHHKKNYQLYSLSFIFAVHAFSVCIILSSNARQCRCNISFNNFALIAITILVDDGLMHRRLHDRGTPRPAQGAQRGGPKWSPRYDCGAPGTVRDLFFLYCGQYCEVAVKYRSCGRSCRRRRRRRHSCSRCIRIVDPFLQRPGAASCAQR